ncbi:MAG: hypothetical protein L0J54_10660 [Halomonas sp.]|nr:hypothetical protein [Halomonas sp.]MDN6298463.1 hypothetical protein [Halomonas sp.]MDN6315841.1 hypothetical protein [Halomonas sp.]
MTKRLTTNQADIMQVLADAILPEVRKAVREELEAAGIEPGKPDGKAKDDDGGEPAVNMRGGQDEFADYDMNAAFDEVTQ